MSLFVLAPHLEYPPINTDCKFILHRYTTLDLEQKVIFLGKSEILIFYKKELIKKYIYKNKNSSNNKIIPALKSLLLGKNYLYEKQIVSKNFLYEYNHLLKKYNPKTIVFSYIYPLIYLHKNNLLTNKINYLCERHNDDINWFSSLKYNFNFKLRYLISPKNFSIFLYKSLFNIICENSIKWIKNNLKQIDFKVKYIFLTDQDKLNFGKYFDNKNSKVISLSHEIIRENIQTKPNKEERFQKISKCNLLFVGNLSLKMNYDSLKFFSEIFLPKIINHCNREINVNILGFNPSNEVEKLCSEKNLQLIANASDKELSYFYNNSHYAILPFQYTNGFKIKFIESIVYGLPILGTENLNYLKSYKIPRSLFSNDPNEWVSKINSLFEITNEEFYKSKESIKFLKKYFEQKRISKELNNYINE